MGIKTELQNNNVDLKKILEMLGVVFPEADTLDGCSWENISKIAEKGLASNFWSVGDTKKVVLNGTVGTLSLDNYETYVYIIGFDHNGATNTIDFGTFKTANGVDVALVTNYDTSTADGTLNFNMHHWGAYNYGGWAGCDLRYDILGSTDVAPSGYGARATSGRVGYDASSTCATNPVANTLMATLPSELRAVMKPMMIYTDNVAGGTNVESNVTASIDYLPLLAEFEIFGARSYADSYEQNNQAQYAYYANGNSKVKYYHSNMSSMTRWWQRSPYYNNVLFFCSMVTDAGAGTNQGSGSYGLAPIFRV